MPHTRNRHLAGALRKAGSFWPVVALLGPRQSGKSTLFREILHLGKYVSFDDEEALEDAEASAKQFLQKLPRPLILDEAQKCPSIFDAIKLFVDRKRVPGSFFLTGSSQFSAKLGIRESLTGRIGIHYLYPMTLAEAHRSAFEAERAHPEHALPNRFAVEAMVSRFASGGLPVPLFTRDEGLVSAYFQSWVETSILRDARRAYGDGYNPDVAFSILTQMTTALKNGEYASLKHFKQNSRQARRYLSALEDIFLLHRLSPHEDTVGSDLWTFFDTGVLSYFARGVIGEALRISLSRISVLNEIRATCEYAGRRMRPVYYKTARGAPVDLLWEDTLIKISSAPRSQVEYDLRPLRSAMKKLDIKKGFLLWGFDQNAHDDLVGFGKIKMVPWTHYS